MFSWTGVKIHEKKETLGSGETYLHNELASGLNKVYGQGSVWLWRRSIVYLPESMNNSWNPVCHTCLMYASSGLGAEPGLSEKKHLISELAEQQWSFTGSPAPALTLPPDGGCINAESVLSFLFPPKQSRKLGNWVPTTQFWDHRALLFTSPVSDSYLFFVLFQQNIPHTSLVNTGNLSGKVFKKGN